MHALNPKLGAAAVAAVALGALGTAGPALASSSVHLYGSGSSLQANAQNNIWGPASWGGSLTYTATSSGKGVAEFGGGGSFTPANDPNAPVFSGTSTQQLDDFVGTDDAPNSTQITNSDTASGSTVLTIPVAETSVAVVVSLPVGVTLPSGTTSLDLPNAYLNEAVLRTIPAYTDSSESNHVYASGTWGALLGALYGNSFGDTLTGTNTYDGDKTITTEIRVGTSGTSLIFKNYLDQIDSTDWSGFANGNQSWPSGVATDTGGLTNSGANTGGGAEANSVKTLPGTIGYVAVSDALGQGFTNTVQTASDGHQYLYAELQNNGVSTTGATYADPLKTPGVGGGANVDTTQETTTGHAWSGIPTGSGTTPATTTWSTAVISDPNVNGVAGGAYPIAGLTYDLAWESYETTNLYLAYANNSSGYTAAYPDPAATVASYFEYVTNASEGQAAITGQSYYAPLPTNAPRGYSQSIRTDAADAAGAIG